MDKINIKLEFVTSNNKGGKYKIEKIKDNIIYAKKLKDHLLGFYYLVF